MTDVKVEWVASDGLHADHASTPGNYLPIPVVRLKPLRAQLEKLKALNDDAVTSSDRYWVKVAIADILNKLKEPS